MFEIDFIRWLHLNSHFKENSVFCFDAEIRWRPFCGITLQFNLIQIHLQCQCPVFESQSAYSFMQIQKNSLDTRFCLYEWLHLHVLSSLHMFFFHKRKPLQSFLCHKLSKFFGNEKKKASCFFYTDGKWQYLFAESLQGNCKAPVKGVPSCLLGLFSSVASEKSGRRISVVLRIKPRVNGVTRSHRQTASCFRKCSS